MDFVVIDEPLKARNGRRLQHIDGHQSQRLPPRLIPLRIMPLYHDGLPPVFDQLDEGNFTGVRMAGVGSGMSGSYLDVSPLDTELEGPVDLVLPHRDVDAMGKPPVHAVEDDALAVPFDVQDRLMVDEVRGANL